MVSGHVAPLLFSLALGFLLGMSAGRLPMARRYKMGLSAPARGDDLLFALLVLAAFGLGAFLTYAFLY